MDERIKELDDPTTIQFTAYNPDIPPSRLLIGRTFLSGAFYGNPKNDVEQKMVSYGKELFLEVENNDIHYNEIHVTWYTLSSVLSHLMHKRSITAAQECLNHFREEEGFVICYPGKSIYEESFQTFLEYSGERPSVIEIADCLYMMEEGITHCVDWDKDLSVFNGEITLLPHNWWRL